MNAIKIKCSEPTCVNGYVTYKPTEVPIVLGFRQHLQDIGSAVDYEDFRRVTPAVLEQLNKTNDDTETVVLRCKPNMHVRSYEVIKS